MYEHHTGENMFILIRRVLDVVCPRWRMQMIGVGSDGAKSMMGQFQGVVTRLANESANTKFYRVWCGLHQLDLVLKHAYKDLWEKEVVILMKKFIAYLRMQQLLISEMQSTCPQLTTHWLIMGIVCKWLLTHHIALFNHIAMSEETVSATPRMVVDRYRRHRRFNGSHQPCISQIASSQSPRIDSNCAHRVSRCRHCHNDWYSSSRC